MDLGPNLAPLLGPVIGGFIIQNCGWRWNFWFLAILSGACLLLLALFLPETSRRIVGNGSVEVRGIYKTISSTIIGQSTSSAISVTKPFLSKRKFRIPNALTSLYIIFYKDVALIMIVHGTFYMTYSCVGASMSSLFIKVYGLSSSQAGLIYLPSGAGCILASYISGMRLPMSLK